MLVKLLPAKAREGKKAIASVLSKYRGTMEKQGAEITTFRFNPNCSNQLSIEPRKFGLEGDAMI